MNDEKPNPEPPEGDGRKSDLFGRTGGKTEEVPASNETQDPSAIEAFDREGAGIAAKE
jgi:hypothetical protein